MCCNTTKQKINLARCSKQDLHSSFKLLFMYYWAILVLLAYIIDDLFSRIATDLPLPLCDLGSVGPCETDTFGVSPDQSLQSLIVKHYCHIHGDVILVGKFVQIHSSHK